MESIHDAPGVDRRRRPPPAARCHAGSDGASADRSTTSTRFQPAERSGPPLLSRHSSAFANGSDGLPLPERRSSPEAIAAGERRPRWRRVPTETVAPRRFVEKRMSGHRQHFSPFNPEPYPTERSWAHLCGVTPIPAGSGKTSGRVRLNRGEDRQAKAALYRIVLTRMSSDEETRSYVRRRRAQGLNTGEIMRCLNRYVARQTFKHLPRAA